MFKSVKSAIAISALAATLGQANAAEVGVMNFTFDAPNRDRLVQALVTYPAEAGGHVELVGDNVVFKGTRLVRDARPQRSKHPLIVVSHGSGGNAANVAWLMSALAKEGYVVVAPNHQGSTSADSTPEATIPATWERKLDMTALLDAIAQSPSLGALVDIGDVTALGFSLGGQTVLGLAGLQMNAPDLAGFCDKNPAEMTCVWFAQGNPLIKGHVDLHKIDRTKFEATYRDPRITRVIAIDPAFVPAYNLASLKSVDVPTQIINLGGLGEIPVTVDFTPVMGGMHAAQLELVDEANHFSFLAECKPLGRLWIKLEGDDPVCRETGNRSRAELHDEIANKIIAFLKQQPS